MAQSPTHLAPGTNGKPVRDARQGNPQRRREALQPETIARRQWRVALAKRLLPAVALILLTAIVAYPEFVRDRTAARMALKANLPDPESGKLIRAQYNGVDERGQPYTVTADTARQVSQDRVDLTDPISDLLTESNHWLQGKAAQGVYIQPLGQLDLQGDVTLYRDDGTTLLTDTATMDMKNSAASSQDKVHVEGPFGVLDAQGFAVTDRGQTMQFTGPGRLIIDGARK